MNKTKQGVQEASAFVSGIGFAKYRVKNNKNKVVHIPVRDMAVLARIFKRVQAAVTMPRDFAEGIFREQVSISYGAL